MPESFTSLEIYDKNVDKSLLVCFAISFIISTYNNVKHYQTTSLLYTLSILNLSLLLSHKHNYIHRKY